MKRKFKISKILCALMLLSPVFSACNNDEPADSPFVDPPENETKQSTILIYAVATNSLSSNLVSDKNEMLQAAENIDLENNNVLLFQTRYAYDETNNLVNDISLVKLIETDGAYDWEVVKEFDDGIASLNPERIKEVIEYVSSNYPAENTGLIFWSHSTGSQPYISDSYQVGETATSEPSYPETLPSVGSFGQDKIYSDGDPFYQINVDDLADAIPDHFFDFIWFDSCYMSNIETIYQLRDKCDLFAGYPTEVLDAGMPYHFTLPTLCGKNPDVKRAAQQFFSYYSDSSYSAYQIATVAVIDMTKISEFLDSCRPFVFVDGNVSVSDFMKYTRYSNGPFFDLGDYIKAMAAEKGETLAEDVWNDILDNCVIYKAATPTDFTGKRIDPERYSGISAHIYDFSEDDLDKAEYYYRSLDWYKDLFE